MLTDDSYISHMHGNASLTNSVWSWIEKAIVFFIILTYSGLWVAILIGPTSEAPSMTAPDPGPMARASWFPTYLALLTLLGFSYKKLLLSLTKFWPLLLLWGLCIVSIFWSLDPEITQRRVIALSFTFFTGFYLAIRAPLLETLRLIAWAWLCICILNLLVIFGIPHWGVHSELHTGAWRGLLIEKNHLGGEFARANLIFLVLLFWDGRKENGDRKKAWWVGLTLTWLLILGSTSKTALIATIIPYIGILFYQIAIRTPIMGLIAIWAGLSLAGIGYAILALFPEAVVALIGKDLTFTGRTDIWSLVIELINQHKFTGFGYGAFWVTEDGPMSHIVNKLDWSVPTAHNGWLEIGLSLGYPGLFLIMGITFFCLFKAAFLASGKHGPFIFLFIFQILLFSLSESLLMEQNSHASALLFFFLTYTFLARKVRPDLDVPKLNAPSWAHPPRTTRRR